MPFEVLEHTADIGFRATAASWPELLTEAAQALVHIYLDASQAQPAHTWRLEAQGEDREDLLVNWLNEVLYLVDGLGVAPHRFDVTLQSSRLSALVHGEPRGDTHQAKLIVKGVTYHQLRIAETPAGWECQVFLDI